MHFHPPPRYFLFMIPAGSYLLTNPMSIPAFHFVGKQPPFAIRNTNTSSRRMTVTLATLEGTSSIKKKSHIRYFLLFVFEPQKRSLTKDEIQYRVLNVFQCIRILIAHQHSQNQFHVAIQCANASKHTALSRLKQAFPEVTEQCRLHFERSWLALEKAVRKHDTIPLFYSQEAPLSQSTSPYTPSHIKDMRRKRGQSTGKHSSKSTIFKFGQIGAALIAGFLLGELLIDDLCCWVQRLGQTDPAPIDSAGQDDGAPNVPPLYRKLWESFFHA